MIGWSDGSEDVESSDQGESSVILEIACMMFVVGRVRWAMVGAQNALCLTSELHRVAERPGGVW